ncbi:unnamed protein product [Lactuca saligna]|uniref:Aspartate/glutamate/uridylate kinase domain-containing protein n=1 Tax=Lactuca saligna TaxID=75948 RepID=A0AA35ZEM4_LACSI|nr:unnamed protein product [Lactuca saligna]
MTLYDILFSQLDVISAQFIVIDNDFRSPKFRKQLTKTFDSLLSNKDSSSIFWGNDSLATLVALELKFDLLVLLSDVDGIYSDPPSNPQSKLIHTYIKEKLENTITFGDMSRLRRGGMTAIVKVVVYASQVGIPVIITSGFAREHIVRKLQGHLIGTLFHQDAHTWVSNGELKNARDMAIAVRKSSRHPQVCFNWFIIIMFINRSFDLLIYFNELNSMSVKGRSKILLDIVDALEANWKVILHENGADFYVDYDAGYETSLVSRLALNPGKVSSLVKAIRVLANMEEPIRQGCLVFLSLLNLILEVIFYEFQVILCIVLHFQVRNGIRSNLGDVKLETVPCGVGNAIGNKGGVGLTMRIYRWIICFVNCHFAAHLDVVNRRNADFDHVYKTMSFSRPSNLLNSSIGMIVMSEIFLFFLLATSSYSLLILYGSLFLPALLFAARVTSMAMSSLSVDESPELFEATWLSF